jgi:hypothetical protein
LEDAFAVAERPNMPANLVDGLPSRSNRLDGERHRRRFRLVEGTLIVPAQRES